MSPGAGCHDWGILLCPHESGVLTKVKTFDEALTLDDSRAPWLGGALGAHRERRIRALRSRGMSRAEAMKEPRWSFGRGRYLVQYWRVASLSGVLWVNTTLYGHRNGGAHRDVLLKTRGLPKVMRRVQWILERCGQAAVRGGRKARESFASRACGF